MQLYRGKKRDTLSRCIQNKNTEKHTVNIELVQQSTPLVAIHNVVSCINICLHLTQLFIKLNIQTSTSF